MDLPYQDDSDFYSPVEKEHKLIQSYLLEKYFVSTAYRQSSAAVIPAIWYYETIVWEWNKTTGKRGNMIDIQDSGSGKIQALRNHTDICLTLIKSQEAK